MHEITVRFTNVLNEIGADHVIVTNADTRIRMQARHIFDILLAPRSGAGCIAEVQTIAPLIGTYRI